MRNYKKVLAILLVSSMAVSFAACSATPTETSSSDAAEASSSDAAEASSTTQIESKEPLELVFFHCKTEVQAGFEELAAAFNSEYPQYNVVMEINQTGGAAGRQEKFASGNPPAMMYSLDFSALQLKTYLDNDLVIPVEDMELFSQVSPKFKEGLYFPDEHIYGVPILSCGKGIMYNSELFAKAGITDLPTTTEELWAACDKLVAAGITPFSGGLKDEWTIRENLWRIFYVQNADATFTQKRIAGEVKFADELIPNWAAWLDQYAKYSTQPVVQIDWATALGELVQEKAAMIINGPWTIQSLNEMDPAIGAKFRMMGDITTNDPSKNVIVEDVDTVMLIVNKSAESIEGSKEFLTWVVTSPTAKTIFQKSINCINPIGIDINGTAVDSDIMTQSANGNTIFAGVGLDVPAGWESEVAVLSQRYLIGEITVEEFGEKVDQAWDTMYADSQK